MLYVCIQFLKRDFDIYFKPGIDSIRPPPLFNGVWVRRATWHPSHTQFNPRIRLKLFSSIDLPPKIIAAWIRICGMLVKQVCRLQGTSDPCKKRHMGGKSTSTVLVYKYVVHSMGSRGWHVTPARWPWASSCIPLKYDLPKFDHTRCHLHLCHVF